MPKYLLVYNTISISGAGTDDAAKQEDERNKGVIFKNCAPFSECVHEINNAQMDNAKHLDIMMPMHNYMKTSGSLWQYYRDDPNDNIAESVSFKFKIITTGKTSDADNTKDVKIAVPLKYLSNFWRTLEMLLINWEINLILTWSADYVIFSAAGETKFEISDTKCYVPTITLSTQHNSKLLQQLKSGFQRNIN